jgi:hypothetical protein
MDEFKLIFPPAFMHAAGHVAANLSFAAVAISLTHTVKTLEPVFNVIMSYFFMGSVTPFPVLLTLIPIMVRGRSPARCPMAVVDRPSLGWGLPLLDMMTFPCAIHTTGGCCVRVCLGHELQLDGL